MKDQVKHTIVSSAFHLLDGGFTWRHRHAGAVLKTEQIGFKVS